jgi:histidyl-tRNA synthetase
MIDEKGLSPESADQIGEYVRLSGGLELIEKLLIDEKLKNVKSAVAGLQGMKTLVTYCNLFGVGKEVLFDLSLARGLDYYTGVIYEAVLKGEPVVDDSKETTTVGSVAGGGRYDNLVGMFDPKSKQVPCVGVSIGVERIFAVLEAKYAAEGIKMRTTDVEVYVASAHKGLHERRLEILNDLWNGGIKVNDTERAPFQEFVFFNQFTIHFQAEHSYKLNPKLLAQLQYCEENQIPFAIILGDSELERGVVKLREISTRKEDEIKREFLTEELNQRIGKLRN